MNASGDPEHRQGPPPLPADFGQPLAPIGSEDRIVSMDILRGLALLGILVINIIYFSHPMDDMALRHGLMQSTADAVAEYFAIFLVEGKCYTLFAFLFGMGFAVQLNRAKMRGKDLGRTHRRRLLLLMGAGLAHSLFLWEGDVLWVYGLLGFGLLLFRNRQPKTLILWAGIGVVIQTGLFGFIAALLFLLQSMPDIAGSMDELIASDPQHLEQLKRAFVNGSYWDAVAYRVRHWYETALLLIMVSSTFFAMFLLGMHPLAQNSMRDPEAHRVQLKTCLIYCGGIGLVINAISAALFQIGMSEVNMGMALTHMALVAIGGPLLTLAYVSLFLLNAKWLQQLWITQAIGKAGRMALTHYLMQSLIATTLFYGYGFGWGGDLGRLETILLAICIFVVQVIFSLLWLKAFRYGPAEWLWRSLTYRRMQPMRIGAEAPEDQ